MGTRLRFFSDECWVVPRRPAAPSAEAVGNTTPPGTEVVTDRSTKLASVPRAARREAQREAARSAEREARQEVGAPVAQAPGTPAQPAGPSDTEGGRRPKASPDSKPGVVPNAEPECEADSEPGVKPDSEMDCEVNFEPGADPDQKPDCEANSESGIEPDNESECESDFEPGAGSYFEPDWVEALVDPAGMEAQKALYAEVEAAIEEAREAVKLDPGAPGPIVVVEITNKVMGDHFYLRPDPEVDDILLGVLGRSIEKTGVAFYAGHGMSNHQGMLVGVNSCHQLASFTHTYFQQTSVRVRKHLGLDTRLWAGRYHGIVLSGDEAIQARRAKYSLANGTKENLVAHPSQWPGIQSARYFCNGEQLVGHWTNHTAFGKALRRDPNARIEDHQTRHVIKHTKLPGFAHLTNAEYTALMRRWCDEAAEEAAAKRREEDAAKLLEEAAAVEVGPVQVHVHIGSAAEEQASPGGRQRIDVQPFVADETVDLFDGVLVAKIVNRSQPTADGMNVERGRLGDTDDAILQGSQALRVHVLLIQGVEQGVCSFNHANALGFCDAAAGSRSESLVSPRFILPIHDPACEELQGKNAEFSS